jgi:ATP-dependent RNA helicase RhlE
MSFSSLGLAPALVQAIELSGLSQPSPIQAQAIPVLLAGHDAVLLAPTGSGKTLAYAAPLLSQLLQPDAPPRTADAPNGVASRSVSALVLVPTRELANQVGEVLRGLLSHVPQRIRLTVAYGGVSINPQLMRLRGGSDIVVATPGRLLDLLEHNALSLSTVRSWVLDEADRLLDLGFADELNRIVARLPAQRQTIMCSATFAPELEALGARWMREPRHRLAVEASASQAPPADIVQRAVRVDAPRRAALLQHLIKAESWKRVLVFVATRYAAEHIANKLFCAGVYATALHGDLSQGARQQVLDEFKSRRWDVLVTTDLASRGIDIHKLEVVINFDLPRSADDYVHRIGRTGRAGSAGLALSFVSAGTESHFHLIDKRQALALTLETIAGFEPTTPVLAPTEKGQGGIKGRRPSKKDKLRAAAAAAAAPTSTSATDPAD